MSDDARFKELHRGAHVASLGEGWFTVVCFDVHHNGLTVDAWADSAGALTESEARASQRQHNAVHHPSHPSDR